MTIEAVIWDFGGVFTTSPFEAFNRYEAQRGLPSGLIRTVNTTNPDSNAWALFERGEIDGAGFDRKFLEETTALGHPVRGAEILPLLSGEARPRMVEALTICKQRFKVGCITNNMVHGNGSAMAKNAESASRAGDIMQHFDAIIESSKVGVRKPDPRIYLMMCERLRRRDPGLRLPGRLGHQLQGSRAAWHGGDQGGERAPGFGRPRRRHRTDLPQKLESHERA